MRLLRALGVAAVHSRVVKGEGMRVRLLSCAQRSPCGWEAQAESDAEARALLQIPKTGKGKKGSQPVNKDRFVSKMFLRGDTVIMVLRNPK